VSEQVIEREHRVTPLELLFDLVFVFGFAQVTTLLSNDPDWTGLLHGVLILIALWWAWAGYAWLTTTIDADDGAAVAALLVAISAMFVAALAVPGAFSADAVVFGVAFFVVAAMHIALFSLGARGDRDLLGAILRVAPAELGGASLILVAGFVHGSLRPVLWVVALIVGFLGPLLGGISGWRVEPAHFVERHGLIVIIAIGESLIAIGLGARATSLGIGEITAALLGLVVVFSFWLAYFDYFTIRGQQLLDQRTGAERTALARDAYSYLHLPMVGGIVLFAFALKTTLAHVDDELATVPALCLCFGPALYLLAYTALRLRVSHALGGGRLVAGLACLAVVPVALAAPALVPLALLAFVWLLLHGYELIWWRDARAELRGRRAPASAS
jgi:low temperature requirement protein LtrA